MRTKEYYEAMAKQFHYIALGHKWEAKASEIEGDKERKKSYIGFMRSAEANERAYRKMAKEGLTNEAEKC